MLERNAEGFFLFLCETLNSLCASAVNYPIAH